MKVGIIGFGWVGKAQRALFPEAEIYDPYYEEEDLDSFGKFHKPFADTKEEVNTCAVTFVCVPTPNKKDGTLNIKIVEDAVKWCESDIIVIRSTVNPGDCDRLAKKYDKRLVFQPEYLGESVAHPLLDPKTRPFVILGGKPEDTRVVIETYHNTYNADTSIRQTTLKEAEVIKLSENRAIAFKVSQVQELYDACEAAGVDFYVVRDAVYGDDPRFNLWWTFVYPEARGFDSKCIPKDVIAWSAWAKDSELTDAVLKYNARLLRGNSSNPE